MLQHGVGVFIGLGLMANYRGKSNWIEGAAVVMQVGLTMSGSVLLCLLSGRWIGNYLGYPGVFISLFTLLGIVGGANVCYRQIVSTEVSENKETDLL